ncbi:unnamed protein product [Closterium sp. Yama58-4]|nr:unnamed protein product [Closterium sp. Yama58-4]
MINAARLIPAPSSCGKLRWPEVVGMEGTKARNYILASEPQCRWDVKLIPPNGYATGECRRNQLRLFLDNRGLVRTVPVTCIKPPQG